MNNTCIFVYLPCLCNDCNDMFLAMNDFTSKKLVYINVYLTCRNCPFFSYSAEHRVHHAIGWHGMQLIRLSKIWI